LPITVPAKPSSALGLGVDLKPDSFRIAVAAFPAHLEVRDSVPLVLILDDAPSG